MFRWQSHNWEGSMSKQCALPRKKPCSYMKTTISDLTLKTQGTITVSTIKESLNLLSFKWKASIILGGVKNYTVCMARRSPVHSLKTTMSDWTVKKQGSITVGQLNIFVLHRTEIILIRCKGHLVTDQQLQTTASWCYRLSKIPLFIKFYMYMKTILDVAVDECIKWMTQIKMESYYLV